VGIKVHVFTSDLPPLPGCPRTAGGNRSMQVIKALRNAGHEVTFSMPLDVFLAKTYAHHLVSQMTQEERWCSEHFTEPEVVLNRIQPDVAIYCNINNFHTIRRFSREIVHILDMYGPLQFEGLLIEAQDPESARCDSDLLESRCRELVSKLQGIDYVITVSERQKYFWSAYCSAAGFAPSEIDVLVCPVAFDIPEVTRKQAHSVTAVYSGGFYPWQKPEASLSEAATILDAIPGAELHVFGGPHAGLPNEASVNQFLARLRRHPSVRCHGYRPVEEVLGTLATAWCALELMEPNAERELAITGRTVEFLSTGTPVIYNDYATLSELIARYRAGWTISPSNPTELRAVFEEIVSGGPELVSELSANAKRLASEQFSQRDSMAALVRLCSEGPRKRRNAWPRLKQGAETPACSPSALVLAPEEDRTASFDSREILFRALETTSCLRFGNDEHGWETLIGKSNESGAVIVTDGIPATVCRNLHKSGIPFIFDLGDPIFRTPALASDQEQAEFLERLELAAAVLAVSPRVVGHLEYRFGVKLAAKSFIVPSCLPFPAQSPIAVQPDRLLLFQDDLRDAGEIVESIEDFARAYALPVILIGHKAAARQRFTNQIESSCTDLQSLLHVLGDTPTGIGIGPLSGSPADPMHAMSDSRMLLFGGFGHPGIYSAGTPHADSALQACGMLVGNSRAEWMEALEFQYREGWKQAAQHARMIRQQRSAAEVAKHSLTPVLNLVVRQRRVHNCDVLAALRDGHTELPQTADQIGNSSERVHLCALAKESERLRNEILALTSSMSWRITAPIRNFSRPVFAAAERMKSAQARR
jgi:glycosyltransferase involved in cell wall biosynthesis